MNTVFDDRYGGRLPSSLRVCSGPCEGMGSHPQEILGVAKTASVDDRYEFVRCAVCHGTGRAPWLAVVVRLPGWFAKATRFFWEQGIKDAAGNPWPTVQRWRIVFTIAYLNDWKWLFR